MYAYARSLRGLPRGSSAEVCSGRKLSDTGALLGRLCSPLDDGIRVNTLVKSI